MLSVYGTWVSWATVTKITWFGRQKWAEFLVTADTDFLVMASTGIEHAGLIFGAQEDHSLGDWVKGLELICFVFGAEDMRNRVEFLP